MLSSEWSFWLIVVKFTELKYTCSCDKPIPAQARKLLIAEVPDLSKNFPIIFSLTLSTNCNSPSVVLCILLYTSKIQTISLKPKPLFFPMIECRYTVWGIYQAILGMSSTKYDVAIAIGLLIICLRFEIVGLCVDNYGKRSLFTENVYTGTLSVTSVHQ